jgi:N-hydroxyarylamine O-acetyltransferase
VTLHRWDEAVVQPAGVLLANHYTATHPDSWFTWQPLLVRRDPETRAELTDHEFAAALTGEFALPLSGDEVAAAVAAPVGRPALTSPWLVLGSGEPLVFLRGGLLG